MLISSRLELTLPAVRSVRRILLLHLILSPVSFFQSERLSGLVHHCLPHLFFCPPRMQRPVTSGATILFMQLSSSLFITLSYDTNLTPHILSVVHIIRWDFLLHSFLIICFRETPSLNHGILISDISSHFLLSSSLLWPLRHDLCSIHIHPSCIPFSCHAKSC